MRDQIETNAWDTRLPQNYATAVLAVIRTRASRAGSTKLTHSEACLWREEQTYSCRTAAAVVVLSRHPQMSIITAASFILSRRTQMSKDQLQHYSERAGKELEVGAFMTYIMKYMLDKGLKLQNTEGMIEASVFPVNYFTLKQVRGACSHSKLPQAIGYTLVAKGGSGPDIAQGAGSVVVPVQIGVSVALCMHTGRQDIVCLSISETTSEAITVAQVACSLILQRIHRCLRKFTRTHVPFSGGLPSRGRVTVNAAELFLRRRRGQDCGAVQGGSRLVRVVNCGQAFRGTCLHLYKFFNFVIDASCCGWRASC